MKKDLAEVKVYAKAMVDSNRARDVSWGPAFGRLPLCLSLQPKRPSARYLIQFLSDSNPQLGFSALLGILGWSAGVWVSMGAGHVMAYAAIGLR